MQIPRLVFENIEEVKLKHSFSSSASSSSSLTSSSETETVLESSEFRHLSEAGKKPENEEAESKETFVKVKDNSETRKVEREKEPSIKKDSKTVSEEYFKKFFLLIPTFDSESKSKTPFFDSFILKK